MHERNPPKGGPNLPLRLLSLLVALPVFAAFTPVFAEEGPEESPPLQTMTPDELSPGMTGYGLTVFSGTGTERFDVEIKGVLKEWFVGSDLIVAELSHPVLEEMGVISGMSGSPVFVDDKLIGAVAYGWSFQRRAICGITPIGDMLGVLELVTAEPQLGDDEMPPAVWPEREDEAARQALEPVRIPARQLREFGLEDAAAEGEAARLKPLTTPLLVSSTNPLVMEKLEELFADTAFTPVMAGAQGGGIGDRRGEEGMEDIPMENGSAVSVLLADGDLKLAGIGTTTLVEGDRMIAYGHPFMGMGPMDAPVALAEVVTVIPSMMMPFKLGNVVREVGALRQDRRPAIGATFASRARLVPMEVSVSAGDTERSREYNFRLWENRNFLPQLALICLIESLDEVSRTSGPMSLHVEYDVRLADGRTMSRQEYLSGESMAGMLAAVQMSNDVGRLVNNRFEPVKVDSISARLEMVPRQQLMALERVERRAQRLYPGETFRGGVEFLTWRGQKEWMGIEVELPGDLRPGHYEVHVVDGGRRGQLERQFRPELDRVESLDDLLRRAEPVFPRNAAHVLLVDPREDLTMRDRRMPSLPRSVDFTIRQTVRETGGTGTARGRLLSEERVEFDAELMGNAVIEIEVLDPADRFGEWLPEEEPERRPVPPHEDQLQPHEEPVLEP